MIEHKEKSTFRHKLKSAVKSIDAYALPVTLSYANKTKFRTLPGGILTILSRFIILLFFIAQIPELVNKSKTVQYKTVKVNLSNDNDPFILNKDNFDMAVRVYSPYGPLSDEMKYNRSKYFKFEFSQTQFYPVVKDNKQTIVKTNTVYEAGLCTTERLGNLTESTAPLLLTSPEWVCPKQIEQQLKGSIYTQARTQFKFRVVPCNQAKKAGIKDDNVTCATDTDIENAINNHFIQIITYSQYFDENEFNTSPVKGQINNLMHNIAPNLAFVKPNLYQRVSITTMDSWFGSSFGNKHYQYLQNTELANSQIGSIKPGVHDMITYTYSKYDEEQVIERRVTSLMDILAIAGGFSSVIMFVSLLASQLFQQQLFEKSLIKRIFKEQSLKNIYNLQKSDTSQDLCSSIITDLMSRKAPSIYYIQYFKQMIRKMTGLIWRRNISQAISSKLDVYTQNLHSKIDIVALIQNVSHIKMIQEMILTNKQRKLLPYLDINLIKPNEHSYHRRLQSSSTSLSEDQLKQSIESLLKNIHKNKRDKTFLSTLANVPINKEIYKKEEDQRQMSSLRFKFASGQDNDTSKTPKSQIPSQRLLMNTWKQRQIVSMNDTNRGLIKNQFEDFNE